jgi:hypothetical protein
MLITAIHGDDLIAQYRPTYLAEQSKFTRRIATAPLPAKLKMYASVSKYHGAKVLDDHLHAFNGAEFVQRLSMPTLCHIFVETLV